MSLFRSNLNGITRTNSLNFLKEQIATCFNRWLNVTLNSYCQKYSTFQAAPKPNYNLNCSIHSVLQKFGKKFEKFPIAHGDCRGNKFKCDRDRKVGLLLSTILSSTVIAAAASTVDCESKHKKPGSSEIMTISDETIFNVREEYPHLDIEVRSILMTRSQDGATISDIKEDYHKLTGMKFPIYRDITDFLLTIPSVTAYCNERGTRIFNVLPSAKTKHIYDMVQQQKPQPQPTQQQAQQIPVCTRLRPNEKRSQPSDEAYMYPLTYGQHLDYGQLWYPFTPYYGQLDPHNYQFIDYNNYNGNVVPVPMDIPPQLESQLHLQRPPIATAANSASESDPEDTQSHNHNIYQDNINYLSNRFCFQQNNPQQTTNHNVNTSSNINNDNIAPIKPIIPSKNRTIIGGASKQHKQNYYQNHYNQRKLSNQYKYTAQARSTTLSCSKSHSDSAYTSDSDYDAHLLDFPLLGDDFFLYMARMELNCRYKKVEKIIQSGLCVSGQSITAALKRIRKLEYCNKKVIVNIGSVDIMQGQSLVQIEHDFRELIRAMQLKGMKPIITTLAPLANYAHDAQMKTKLERFNNFLKKGSPNVIDIWSCLVNERKQILFDCYQHEPRIVTGTKEPYLFWNKIGRQRVLQLIESKLEY